MVAVEEPANCENLSELRQAQTVYFESTGINNWRRSVSDFIGACFEFCLYVFTDDKPSRATRIVRAVIIWLILFVVLSAAVAAGLKYFFN